MAKRHKHLYRVVVTGSPRHLSSQFSTAAEAEEYARHKVNVEGEKRAVVERAILFPGGEKVGRFVRFKTFRSDRPKKWIQAALGVRPRRRGLRASGYTPKLHHRRQHVKSVRVEPLHKGELHRELGVPMGEKIPMVKLRAAAKRGGHVGKRARLAITLRGLGHA